MEGATLDAGLQGLKDQLLGMAGRVESMITEASQALLSRDRERALQVVESDRRVNRAEMDIDGVCLTLLETHHPTGKQLRFVTQSLKMVADIERIGDLAVNVAERAAELSEFPTMPVHTAIEVMAECVREMVGEAIDSFVASDGAQARRVIDRDDEVDDAYARVFRETLDLMLEDKDRIRPGIIVQSAAKVLERIGDHATNLAEQVVFMVQGEDIRHLGKRDSV